VKDLDRPPAAERAAQPNAQRLEREIRAIALAQRREIELAAVAAAVTIRIDLVVVAEIARPNGDGSLLARSVWIHESRAMFSVRSLHVGCPAGRCQSCKWWSLSRKELITLALLLAFMAALVLLETSR
jgi:hypothetical protein